MLLKAIDEGLLVLGDEPRAAFYQYLATMHSLAREDIPDRLQEFSLGLKKALGGAYTVVQRIILRKLFQQIGQSLHEAPGLEFVDYVSQAKTRFQDLVQQGIEARSSPFIKSKKSQVTS